MILRKCFVLFVYVISGVFYLAESAYCAAPELYLDGVNIMGSMKSAYVQLDGAKTKVVIGDVLAGYEVVGISPRAIKLRDNAGEFTELSLHSSLVRSELNSHALESKMASGVSNDPDRPAVISPPRPQKLKDGTYKITPHFIKDEDIPEGYSKKRTPFGDFLIRKK